MVTIGAEENSTHSNVLTRSVAVISVNLRSYDVNSVEGFVEKI